jgi:uncharacterized RDD family membrane protein YckC
MIGMDELVAPVGGQSPHSGERSVSRDASHVGLWARVAAGLVDATVLGATGYAIGLPLAALWATLGRWGVLVGYLLAVLYWGLLGSRLGGGQSLGKRLLYIRVTGSDGAQLPVMRSLVRAAILALPLGIVAASTGVPPVVTAVRGMPPLVGPAVAGGGWQALVGALYALCACQLYLVIFNLPTRRLVHDLLCGTHVARESPEPASETQPIRPVHAWVLGIMVSVAVVPAAGRALSALAGAPHGPQWATVNAIERLAEVRAARVSPVCLSPITGKRELYVAATLRGVPRDRLAALDSVARAALATDTEAETADDVTVVVQWGWSVGLASSSLSQGARYPPSEWRQRLGASAQ